MQENVSVETPPEFPASSVVNYLVNDRQERARWLAQNSFGLHSQVNKKKFMEHKEAIVLSETTVVFL
jgi:hypothetical protein